jgi:hypothetical protein
MVKKKYKKPTYNRLAYVLIKFILGNLHQQYLKSRLKGNWKQGNKCFRINKKWVKIQATNVTCELSSFVSHKLADYLAK